MRKKPGILILFVAGLLLLGFVSSASAATVELVPTSSVTNVVNGDLVEFEVYIDFSPDGGTIGGGFDINFDSSAVQFVSLTNAGLGDPGFGRDPDILDGLLESWAVGDFNGLSAFGPELVGSVIFQVLPTMGENTFVTVSGTSGIGGPWVSSLTFTIIFPDYNQVEVIRTDGPLDSDGDGIPDADDNCPADPNPGQEDRDGDDVGDVCDNCPDVPNPGQEDSNGDGIGDACTGGGGGPAACDMDGDGDIDGHDIRLISPARGRLVTPGDLGDFDVDGEITRRDVTACAKLL